MFRIDSDTFYTRADLAALLKGTGVDVDTFIARVAPRKIFRFLFFGGDLLKALEDVQSLETTEGSGRLPLPGNRGPGKGSGRRSRQSSLRTVFSKVEEDCHEKETR